MELESVNKSLETIQASKQKYLNLDAMIQNMASDEKKVFYQLIIEEVVIKDNKYSERSKEILKKIMLVFEEDNLKVYGKTLRL